MPIRWGLWSLLIFITTNAVQASTYYVCDANGEYGKEDGSSPANCFDGGDSIRGLRAGDTLCIVGTHNITSEFNRIYPAISGTSVSPIVIDGQCPEVSSPGILDGKGTGSRLLNLEDRQNIIVRNLRLRNSARFDYLVSGYSSTGAGVARNVTLDNLKIENCGGDCLWLWGANWTVKNSLIDGCSNDCIYVKGGQNLTVSDNTILNISRATTSGDGIQMDSSGINQTGQVRIQRNYIDHTLKNVKYGILAHVTGTGKAIVEGNTVLAQLAVAASSTNPIYVNADGRSTTTVEIVGNTTFGGYRPITLAGAGGNANNRHLVAGNIVASFYDVGIWVDADSNYTDILNNTVVGDGRQRSCFFFNRPKNEHSFANNIAKSCGDYGAEMFGIKGRRSPNLYYGNLVDVRDLPMDQRDLHADPLLNSSFQITVNSPAWGAGSESNTAWRGRCLGATENIGATCSVPVDFP